MIRRMVHFNLTHFLTGLICIVSVYSFVPRCVGQERVDVIVTKRENGKETVKRRGEIVDWKGDSLTLRSNGRDREIKNQEIVEVQTAWTEEYVQGCQFYEQGNVAKAAELLQKAIQTDPRDWADRIARAKLIDIYLTLEQPAAAVEQFIQILADDRETRFFYQMPIPWFDSGQNLIQPARKWISTNDPVGKLLGASWLIESPDRDKAIKVLEELSGHADPTVKSFAIAQLWRIRPNPSSKQVEVWKNLVNKMPRDLRAGPLSLLANGQMRAGQANEAMISLMKIRILYPKQKTLGAAALYRASLLLQNKGNTSQAKLMLSELVSQFPQSVWARQAGQ